MNTHKAFILGVALLSTIGVKAQFAIDNYKAVFTSSPQHVPTTKTPDAPLAGNGDIGITMGGTPDKLCFYIGKNELLQRIIRLSLNCNRTKPLLPICVYGLRKVILRLLREAKIK